VPIPAPGRPAAVKFRETVVDGLDGTLDAFLAMMRGENVGKTVVKL
jgi:NADPH-dependent curcumin reductase CurA